MRRTFIQTEMFTKQWDSLGLTDEDMCRLEKEILSKEECNNIKKAINELEKNLAKGE